jgi:hypothetical protein
LFSVFPVEVGTGLARTLDAVPVTRPEQYNEECIRTYNVYDTTLTIRATLKITLDDDGKREAFITKIDNRPLAPTAIIPR